MPNYVYIDMIDLSCSYLHFIIKTITTACMVCFVLYTCQIKQENIYKSSQIMRNHISYAIHFIARYIGGYMLDIFGGIHKLSPKIQ